MDLVVKSITFIDIVVDQLIAGGTAPIQVLVHLHPVALVVDELAHLLILRLIQSPQGVLLHILSCFHLEKS